MHRGFRGSESVRQSSEVAMIRTERRRIQFGPYCADLRTCELTKHGTRLKLQARPFEILAMLLERPGEVVTRDEIRARLWPDGTFVDFDSNISSAMRKLRDSLCDSAADPRHIETVGRVGYRFIATVEFTGDDRQQALIQPAQELAAAEAVESPRSSVAAPVSAGTRSAFRGSSRRVAVAAMLCVALAIPAIRLLRRWLTSANAAGKVHSSLSRPSQEAAAEYKIGRELWSRRGENPLNASVEHFSWAIAKQPDYGLAYSGLADAYVVLPFYSRILLAEAYPKAKAAALKAVELAPQSAEAHTSLAYVRLYGDWDFRGAEEQFRIALRQNPNYFTALQWHAEYLSLVGRYDDSIREINRALEMAPGSAVMHHNAGQIYQAARRYDEAIEQYRIALRLDPTFSPSNAFMALAYMRKGMYDKAFALEMEYAEYTGDATQIALIRRLASVYRSGGLEQYLRELLAIELEDNPDRDSYRIAHRYAQLGNKDLAFQYFDRAYQFHSPDLLSLNVDPELDPLRSDPRFLALRRRVGLPALEFF